MAGFYPIPVKYCGFPARRRCRRLQGRQVAAVYRDAPKSKAGASIEHVGQIRPTSQWHETENGTA